MLTIRETILQLIKAEITKITTANGYHTNIGLNPVRGRYDLFPTELPAVVMIATQDDSTPHLGHGINSIPLTIAGFVISPNASTSYSDRAARDSEAVLGDILTCLLAPRITLDFSSGCREPSLGSTLTGTTSGATAILESITLSSGSWLAGTAAGTYSLRLPWSSFTAELVLNAGGETLSYTTGTMTRIPPFSNLLNHIEYQQGGMDPLPDPGEDVIKTSVTFAISYATLAGNPYKQS